ncbi:HNH endonuclease [Bradyrhizobium sp. 2]|nr:HNH endonuclease [Bradyrhizobium sp. 2]
MDNGRRCFDHVDGNKVNNAISNLREVTHKENMSHYWASIGSPISLGSTVCRTIIFEAQRKLRAFSVGKTWKLTIGISRLDLDARHANKVGCRKLCRSYARFTAPGATA